MPIKRGRVDLALGNWKWRGGGMDAAKLRFEAKLQRWPLMSNDIPQSEQLYIREYCPIFASNNSS